jgi:hypothetical protein
MATRTPIFAHRMTTPLRQTWKGLWLLGVAAVHTVFAVLVFQPQLQEIVQRGVFDSVGADPMLGAVTWFVLFGGLFALLGWSLLLVERNAGPEPVSLRVLGAGLLALALLGIVLMPASGFWLVLPPAFALCLRPRQ